MDQTALDSSVREQLGTMLHDLENLVAPPSRSDQQEQSDREGGVTVIPKQMNQGRLVQTVLLRVGLAGQVSHCDDGRGAAA